MRVSSFWALFCILACETSVEKNNMDAPAGYRSLLIPNISTIMVKEHLSVLIQSYICTPRFRNWNNRSALCLIIKRGVV